MTRGYVKCQLGPIMLNYTYKKTNTEKSEATYRAILATVPVTFTRNFNGRVHTSMHDVTNVPGESIVKLGKAVGNPFEPGSCAARGLKKKIQLHNEKHKLYK